MATPSIPTIPRRVFAASDRQALQDDTIAAVESNPQPFLDRYAADPRSLGGRYISADLIRETSPEYNQSREGRARYGQPLAGPSDTVAEKDRETVEKSNNESITPSTSTSSSEPFQTAPTRNPGDLSPQGSQGESKNDLGAGEAPRHKRTLEDLIQAMAGGLADYQDPPPGPPTQYVRESRRTPIYPRDAEGRAILPPESEDELEPDDVDDDLNRRMAVSKMKRQVDLSS